MKDSKGAMAAKEDHPNADLLVDYPTAASTTTTTTTIKNHCDPEEKM